MSGDVGPYTALITSEHNQQPNFMASLTAVLQPFADLIQVLGSIQPLYDVDEAVGVQLDTVGLWVGQSRDLTAPLANVYFSWGTPGLGWGEGTWKGPFDPTTGLIALPDDTYRILIYATIAANQWDGTIPQAYEIWETVFQSGQPILDQDGNPILDEDGNEILDGAAAPILIQDNGDMSMYLALMSSPPDINAVTIALLTNGYFRLKPAGVRMKTMIPSIPATPLFGFGVENDSISGWGVGCWPTVLSEL